MCPYSVSRCSEGRSREAGSVGSSPKGPPPRIPAHTTSCSFMQAPHAGSRALAAAGRVSGRASPWSLAAMGVEDEAWPWAFDAVWGSILAPQAQVFSRARSTVLFGKPAPHACPVQSFGGVPVPSGRQMSA